jgi:hypothetical protein
MALISLQKGGPWKGLHACMAAMISLLRYDSNILVLTGGEGEIKTFGSLFAFFWPLHLLLRAVHFRLTASIYRNIPFVCFLSVTLTE